MSFAQSMNNFDNLGFWPEMNPVDSYTGIFPVCFGLPQITSESDPIILGSVLDCSTGTWLTKYEPINFTYQWYLNGSPIVGATGVSYTTLDGGLYYCLVTATNSLGNTKSVRSNTIGIGVFDMMITEDSLFNMETENGLFTMITD